MTDQLTSAIAEVDPEVHALMRMEDERQQRHIGLIASENYCSRAVMEACGSALTNKYIEGYPGDRYYLGCEVVDAIEDLAIQRAKRLFGVDYANVQPHSGSGANASVYLSILRPGDKFLGWDLDQGGHFTHGSPRNLSGFVFRATRFTPHSETGLLDYDAIRDQAKRETPRLIAVGASSYPRIIDFALLRAIADEVGACFLADIAHISGLVAAGVHPSPVGHAHFITSTTHKTLRGPRGGMILSSDAHAERLDAGVHPGTQGGALAHVIAAKAIAFKEALEPDFAVYQRQVLANAQLLAARFREAGLEMLTGGTDNHLIVLKTDRLGMSGRAAALLLESVGITSNKTMIPGDERPPAETSAVRLGTPAITTRGFTGEDCAELATLIIKTLRSGGRGDALDDVRAAVAELCRRRPIELDSRALGPKASLAS